MAMDKTFVKLTEAEIVERSRSLAQRIGERESLKNDAKGRAKDFKDLIKKLDEEI